MESHVFWIRTRSLFCRCNCLVVTFFLQYVADVRTVQKLLQEAEETIDYINKEEAFYEWEQTFYPEVEVIKDSIEPYQKLFGFILTWHRTENRSDFSLMYAVF